MVVNTCNHIYKLIPEHQYVGERGGSVVECRTPEREVGGSEPTAAVLCPWARHFTPPKYCLITQEAVAPSRHDWKIVDWDVKPQHKKNKISMWSCLLRCRLQKIPHLFKTKTKTKKKKTSLPTLPNFFWSGNPKHTYFYLALLNKQNTLKRWLHWPMLN